MNLVLYKKKLISVLVLLTIWISGLYATSRNSEIAEAIDYGEKILDEQYPDGGINMTISRSMYIIPYFGHMGAESLLSLYSVKTDTRYLKAVIKWMKWYVNYLNPDFTVYDYTGYYPRYVSTYWYDSTDSYASGFFVVLWNYYMVTGDKKVLKRFYPYTKKIIKAIELTLDPDGDLTFCTPQIATRYLMDNIEVYQGLYSLYRITEAMGDKKFEKYVENLKNSILKGMQQFWCDDVKWFANEITGEGNKVRDYNTAYPGGLIQVMVYDLLLDRNDPAVKEFIQRILKKYYYSDMRYLIDSNMMFWFAIGAYKAGMTKVGDEMMHYLKENMSAVDKMYVHSHYIRGLLYKYSEMDRKIFNMINLQFNELATGKQGVDRMKVKFNNGVAVIDDFSKKKKYITSGDGGGCSYQFVNKSGKKSLKVNYHFESINAYAHLMILYRGVGDWTGAKSLEFDVLGNKNCKENLMITIIENDGDWWSINPQQEINSTGKWEHFSYPIAKFRHDIWSLGGDGKLDLKNIKGIRIQINKGESYIENTKGVLFFANFQLSSSVKMSKKWGIEITEDALKAEQKTQKVTQYYDNVVDDFSGKFQYKLGELFHSKLKFTNRRTSLKFNYITSKFGSYAQFKAFSKTNFALNDADGLFSISLKFSKKFKDTLQISFVEDDGDIWNYYIDDILTPDVWHNIKFLAFDLERDAWGYGDGRINLANLKGYRIQVSQTKWDLSSDSTNSFEIKPIIFKSTKEIDISKTTEISNSFDRKNCAVIDTFEADTGWAIDDITSAVEDADFDFSISKKEKINSTSSSLKIDYKLDRIDSYIEFTKHFNKYFKIVNKNFYSYQSIQDFYIWIKGKKGNTDSLGINFVDNDGDILSFVLDNAFSKDGWRLKKISFEMFELSEYSQGDHWFDTDKIKEVKLQIIYPWDKSYNGPHKETVFLGPLYVK